MAVVHLSVQRQDQGLEPLPRRKSAGPRGRRARGTGLGREFRSRDPSPGSSGCKLQPEAPAAQPAHCTASKQRAPTGLSPAVALTARSPLLESPWFATGSPRRPARRGMRGAAGEVQGGRGGGPACGWASDLLPTALFSESPPGLHLAERMLQAPLTGHCRRGRSGCGCRGR